MLDFFDFWLADIRLLVDLFFGICWDWIGFFLIGFVFFILDFLLLLDFDGLEVNNFLKILRRVLLKDFFWFLCFIWLLFKLIIVLVVILLFWEREGGICVIFVERDGVCVDVIFVICLRLNILFLLKVCVVLLYLIFFRIIFVTNILLVLKYVVIRM